MKLIPILLLTCAACSNSEHVSVAVSSVTHTGEWVGTISNTSVLTWQLNETPRGDAQHVSGTGSIQAFGCEMQVVIDGERRGADTLLTVTSLGTPDFALSVSGVFVNGRFEGIYATESGSAPPDCIPEFGGALRVGPRNDDGLNGSFQGFWPPIATFSDTATPYASVELVQSEQNVFGTVAWFGGYPCAAGGFLKGTFDGTQFLANVYSQDASNAYHLLEAVWNPATSSMSGVSTLLSPGPSPACPLLGEMDFSMYRLEPTIANAVPEPDPLPIGVIRRLGEAGETLEARLLYRAPSQTD